MREGAVGDLPCVSVRNAATAMRHYLHIIWEAPGTLAAAAAEGRRGQEVRG